MKKRSICLVPEVTSLGGPRTFQQNLIRWSETSDEVEFHFDTSRKDIDAFLVIGGPRRAFSLLRRAKKAGIPVVQRLNGMNWIHRQQPCSLRYKLHSELANLSIAFVRRFLCTRIVYQSPFCQKRWNSVYGEVSQPDTIIFNGVDTKTFCPSEKMPACDERIRILLVEGSFRNGMDFGLDIAAEIACETARRFARPVTLQIAGKSDEKDERRIQTYAAESGADVTVEFCGVCGKERLVELEQQATLLFSAEIHAACPNAVIEAMACGLPVIGFDTGALKDVVGDAGVIVPYGTDPWKLEKPVCGPLFDAAEKVIRENKEYRARAVSRAEETFPIEKMISGYIIACS